MTATFSAYFLESMGFCELIGRGSLTASFMGVTAYEVRGITFPEGFADARQAHVAGVNYRVGVSNSVNAACQRLIGDDFVESEADWRKQVKSTGPFVLIAVGPTDFIECEAGRMMRLPDGSITTYDSFPNLRQALAALESRVLPPVVATLTLELNEPERYVALRKLARAFAGRTPEGATVHDIRLDVRAELSVSHPLDETRALEVLESSARRAPKLHQRAAKYFTLGTAEDDPLKRFLYFFLSLEVETHAVFRRINHSAKVRSQVIREGDSAPRPSTADLIARDISRWENLFDRFVWCATCVWTGLFDDDIAVFKELKNARDAIAHGRESEPPFGFARKAELLAHKVLWVERLGGA